MQGKGNQRFAISGSLSLEYGSIKWDGQLNFYMDGQTDISQMNGGMGKAFGYNELDDIIKEAEKAGKTTVNIGGVDVEVSRLKQIRGYNTVIAASGKNTDGSYNSQAAKYLLDDGYMTYAEAKQSEKEVLDRYNDNQKILLIDNIDAFLKGELFDFEDSLSPTMIEHYSTRFVLNENDKLKEYFSDPSNMQAWTDSNLRLDPWLGNGNATNMFNFGDEHGSAELYSDALAKYHIKEGDLGTYKWVFADGKESILGVSPAGNAYFQEADDLLGTYNFGKNSTSHFYLDMYSYYKWGNTPDDKGYRKKSESRFVRHFR